MGKKSDCDCGAKPDHKKYEAKCQKTKNMRFNRLVSAIASKRKQHQYLVIDTIGLPSSRTIIRRGVHPDNIRALTMCKNDHAEMDAEKIVKCELGHSEKVYANIVDGKEQNLVVVHDGMQTWKNTKPSIKIVLSKMKRPKNVVFLINISPRCGDYSHDDVEVDMSVLAFQYGYAIKSKKHKAYQQKDDTGKSSGTMWPFTFELVDDCI